MKIWPMRSSLALIAVLAAAPALGAEAQVPDAPVATASATQMTTADQIDAYLKTSPALDLGDEGPDGVTPGDDRKVHGEVSVGVGSHGYRSVYARTDLPVGQTGRLSIAVEDTRFNGRFGGYYGGGYYGGDYYGAPGDSQSVGASLRFGGAPSDGQRCDLEGLTPPRPLDITGGPSGRCVRAIPRR